MNSKKIELFLAKLYTNELFLKQFIADPEQILLNEDFDEIERNELLKIDTAGLQMAFNSYKNKRMHIHKKPIRRS